MGSFQNLILSKRTNFGEKSGMPTTNMDNSFDMFQSHQSESRMRKDLTSGKNFHRMNSHSLVDRDSRASEFRPRTTTHSKLAEVNEVNNHQ
jgi:hypothetical protein